jgi:hypothetical protein
MLSLKPKTNTVTMSVEDLLTRLPVVKDDPRMQAVFGKLRELEDQLREVRLAMSPGGGSNNFADANALPRAKYDRTEDAVALLAGEITLADLAGKNITTVQNDLARQRDALESAISLHRETVRTVTAEVIADLCDTHAGDIVPFFRHVIESFERLETALQDVADLDAGMHRLGYRHDHRPGGWRILDKEIAFLKGGPEFQSIRWWVENRKQHLAYGDYADGK